MLKLGPKCRLYPQPLWKFPTKHMQLCHTDKNQEGYIITTNFETAQIENSIIGRYSALFTLYFY